MGRLKTKSKAGGDNIMIDPGLKDKVVLVTGGNNPSGIGAAIARAFGSHGARIFIHYLRQEIDLSDREKHDSPPQVPGLAFFFAAFVQAAGIDGDRCLGGYLLQEIQVEIVKRLIDGFRSHGQNPDYLAPHDQRHPKFGRQYL